MNNWICPKCKKSDYSISSGGMTTLMYFEPHYVNGVNVNPDRNTRSSEITCHSCHRIFDYSTDGETSTTTLIRKQRKEKIYHMDGSPSKDWFWS